MTTREYLYDTEETNRIRELAMGVVREPPAPLFSHQSLVLQLARIRANHMDPRQLGRVAVAPVDVILDRARALIVQPDVLFVSAERLSISAIRCGARRIWWPKSCRPARRAATAAKSSDGIASTASASAGSSIHISRL
jgi:hypothetical protein